MGNRLMMTTQLHEAVSRVLADGLGIDLEAGESLEGCSVTLLNIRFYHPVSNPNVSVKYIHGRPDVGGYFCAGSQGLCEGRHATIEPFLAAIATHPDAWLRAPHYVPPAESGQFASSEAWQLLLA